MKNTSSHCNHCWLLQLAGSPEGLQAGIIAKGPEQMKHAGGNEIQLEAPGIVWMRCGSWLKAGAVGKAFLSSPDTLHGFVALSNQHLSLVDLGTAKHSLSYFYGICFCLSEQQFAYLSLQWDPSSSRAATLFFFLHVFPMTDACFQVRAGDSVSLAWLWSRACFVSARKKRWLEEKDEEGDLFCSTVNWEREKNKWEFWLHMDFAKEHPHTFET